MQGVTLDSIGGGALAELFAAELQKVLANIADPNTDEKAKRAIQISVVFKPRERDVADIELKCASKLAGIVTVKTQLFMGKHQGRLVAVDRVRDWLTEALPKDVAVLA
jgi:hypothetical protein